MSTTGDRVVFVMFIIGGVFQAECDIRTRSIPRMTTYLMGCAALLALVLRNTLSLGVVLVALSVGFGMWIVHRVAERSLGFGDVLLAPVITLYVGWFDVSVVPIWLGLAALGAAIMALFSRQRYVAFVPWMVASGVVVILTVAS